MIIACESPISMVSSSPSATPASAAADVDAATPDPDASTHTVSNEVTEQRDDACASTPWETLLRLPHWLLVTLGLRSSRGDATRADQPAATLDQTAVRVHVPVESMCQSMIVHATCSLVRKYTVRWHHTHQHKQL